MQEETSRCVVAVFLADWPQPVQAVVAQEIRHEGLRRELLREFTQLTRSREQEEVERHQRLKSILDWRMRMLFGRATVEDVLSPVPTLPAYDRTPWGLRMIAVDERGCWAPLGFEVSTSSDSD